MTSAFRRNRRQDAGDRQPATRLSCPVSVDRPLRHTVRQIPVASLLSPVSCLLFFLNAVEPRLVRERTSRVRASRERRVRN